MEAQNFKFVYCILTSQSNLEKEDRSWKNQSPWLQITVQATVNKNEEKILKDDISSPWPKCNPLEIGF